MCVFTVDPTVAPFIVPNVYPFTPTPTYTFRLSGLPTYTYTTYGPCNHCYCVDDPHTKAHLVCCKCSDSMHVKFVPLSGNATNDHSECRCTHGVPMGMGCRLCPEPAGETRFN